MRKLLYILHLSLIFCLTTKVFGQSRLTQTIFFDKGSYTINESYKPIIKQVAEKCASDSFVSIKVFGFADTTGTAKYNDELSTQRLEAVWLLIKKYCKKTITKSYLEWVGESPNDYDYHLKSAPFQQRAVLIIVQFQKSKN